MFVGVQVEEQSGEPDSGAEHDPGGEIPPARALHADRLHRTRRDHVAQHEAPERPDSHEIRARAAGGSQIAKRLAREGLAAHDREHADHAGDDGNERPDSKGNPHGFAFEEPGSKERGQVDGQVQAGATWNAFEEAGGEERG